MMQKSTFLVLFITFFHIVLFGQNKENFKNVETPFLSKSGTCQAFTVSLNPMLTSHAIIDTIEMHVCPYDTITFGAEAQFLDPNPIYNQTQNNTKFVWQFADNISDTIPLFSRTFSENGVEMKLYGIDTIGCKSLNEVRIIIKVSGSPVIGNNSPVVGYSGNFTDVSVGFDSSSVIMIDTVYNQYNLLKNNQFNKIDTSFIPDGSASFLSDTIFINTYTNNDSIDSAEDIFSINITLEHSFLDDVSIILYCPSGASTILKHNINSDPPTGPINLGCSVGGTNTSLGSADDSGQGNCYFEPGIGWNYEFRPGAVNCFGAGGPTVSYSYTNLCGQTFNNIALIPSVPNSYSSIPTTPVYYGTYESLSNLNGCPLNGNWILKVKDNYAIDNGFLFGWGIKFSDFYSFPAEFYSLNVDSVSWYGNNITSTGPFTATIYEPNIGVYTYGTKIFDEYGCEYDTTFSIYCFLKVAENENETIPIHFFPNPVSSDLHYTILNDLWDNSSVSILSIQGTQLYKTQITPDSDHFNLSFLSPGNYIIKVQNLEGKEYSVKIIVIK
jgi:subtilisin-like proprotein convertase family protein